ncbi:HepT-like ribonuclease domain-containing protein [Escherichia coli]|uniref:HepT-like ribonuclease domain-containing protein n=1 Tax=Escherichia TaxID=561 RepID=UPI00098B2D07|nr:DUF86 domain-containing protein [Escherichia coli]MXC80275.1 DUF86 domain-containing protein [Escherichia sp. HH26CH]HBH7998794.1 DUF86 domain-containing protein [Escherichia coli]HBH8045376.1 DUF86 domain-containing protein [Escherichia coli]HBK9517035.1 DUF86 domain-containing protein [Escherichia coli]
MSVSALIRCLPADCAFRCNRIAHGYFDINLELVWDTVQTALPELLRQLSVLRREEQS